MPQRPSLVKTTGYQWRCSSGTKFMILSAICLASFVVDSALGQKPVFSFSDSARIARFKQDIHVLASDSLQGRESGTTGGNKARDYIVSEFEEAGLVPKGSKEGSYLQPFPFNATTYVHKSVLSINGNPCKLYQEAGATALSANGEAEGKAAEFALINIGTEHFDTVRMLVDQSFSAGAKAVILYNGDRKIKQKLFKFNQQTLQRGLVIYVSKPVAEQLKEMPNASCRITVDIKRDTVLFYNVIGYLDNHKPKTVIFGGHYDHDGISAKTGLIKYGADDNASGTAMVMELARHLATQKEPLSNYLFIAFMGEELGLLGSEYYAGHPEQSLDSALFMFNFDMVGRLGAKGNRVESVGTASSKAWNRIARESKPVPFRIKKIPGAGPFSDHDGFYKRGVPIAYLTTGMHNDYHTSRDVAEKINYTGMAQIAGYAERITANAEKAADLKYRKVSGWKQFRSMWYYLFEQLDHVLTVGIGDIQ